jgi:hypothetical protein
VLPPQLSTAGGKTGNSGGVGERDRIRISEKELMHAFEHEFVLSYSGSSSANFAPLRRCGRAHTKRSRIKFPKLLSDFRTQLPISKKNSLARSSATVFSAEGRS